MSIPKSGMQGRDSRSNKERRRKKRGEDRK